MAKTWVLETETKGTGAHIAPLRPATGGSEPPLNVTRFTPPHVDADPEPEAPRRPRRFKVVDVLASRTLAEDVDAGGAVAALEKLRKPVDARVYAWQPDRARWRLLGLEETRALWCHRRPRAPAGGGR